MLLPEAFEFIQALGADLVPSLEVPFVQYFYIVDLESKIHQGPSTLLWWNLFPSLHENAGQHDIVSRLD